MIDEEIKEFKKLHKIIKSLKHINNFDNTKNKVLELIVRPHEFYGDIVTIIKDLASKGYCFIEDLQNIEYEFDNKVELVDIYYFKER